FYLRHTAPSAIYTLSLHDALPIYPWLSGEVYSLPPYFSAADRTHLPTTRSNNAYYLNFGSSKDVAISHCSMDFPVSNGHLHSHRYCPYLHHRYPAPKSLPASYW